MRTTVEISDDLFREAKRKAADEHKPLRKVVEEALRLYLKGPSARKRDYRLHWATERGRLQPGVRLDDRDSLFDVMDGRG